MKWKLYNVWLNHELLPHEPAFIYPPGFLHAIKAVQSNKSMADCNEN